MIEQDSSDTMSAHLEIREVFVNFRLFHLLKIALFLVIEFISFYLTACSDTKVTRVYLCKFLSLIYREKSGEFLYQKLPDTEKWLL